MMESTILFVEDSQDDFLLMEGAIRKCDVPAHLHWVQNGLEAISYLSGTGELTNRILTPAQHRTFRLEDA